ncbi:MAG: DUF4160 domain-containing protein [Alkalispirochaeta sp.]
MGIYIYMYFSDHNPPHVHTIYGQFDAEFSIVTGERLRGAFPSRAERFVREWAGIYKNQLLHNWELARNHDPLRDIPPLE